jgi:hypothetical protein
VLTVFIQHFGHQSAAESHKGSSDLHFTFGSDGADGLHDELKDLVAPFKSADFFNDFSVSFLLL